MNANALMYVMRALVTLVAIPFHEAAHALASWKLGDDTAKRYGRLTLNPLAHFDPMGALCMVVAGVGWAKPVPTNASRFQNPKVGMALTALAGPVSNLLLAYLSMVIYKVLYYWAPTQSAFEYLAMFFVYMISMNVSLAVFNLIPVPPLDGSRIALLILPQTLYFRIMRYERYIMLALFALLWLGVLSAPLGALNGVAWDLLDRGTGFIDSIAYRIYLAGMTVTGV